MFSQEVIRLAKPCYKAIPIIAEKAGKKWEWEPEVGELAMIKPDGEIVIILDSLQVAPWQSSGVEFIEIQRPFERGSLPNTDLIPLLHGEKLVEILEGMGYIVSIRRNLEEEFVKGRFCCEIERGFDFPTVVECAPRQQEAVMQAVIGVAKVKSNV